MTLVNDDLPDGWTTTTMGEVAEVVGGGTPKTTIPGNFDDVEGHPWLTPADLTGHREKTISHGRRFLTDQGLTTSAAKYMPAGTILFSSRAPIGYVAIAANPVTTNQGFRSFVPSKRLDSNYAYHYLRSIKYLAEQMASGTTFNELSGSKAKKLPIPLPPVDEQRRIAAWLDEIDARRSPIADRLAAARAIVDRLRTAVLAAACSGRLTVAWRDEQGTPPSEASDGPPTTWKPTRLGDIVRIATGATPLRKNAAYYEGGTIPWVTSGAVNAGIVSEPTELITPRALAETNVKLFPPGTLLIAMYGEGQTRGRVAELAIEAGTNQALAAVVFDDASAPFKPYFRLFFENGYQRMRAESLGGVQPNLSLGIFKETVVPLPPLDEQHEIVERAAAALAISDRLRASISSVERSLSDAARAAVRRAFRGDLVPTEAEPIIGDDEPAHEEADRSAVATP